MLKMQQHFGKDYRVQKSSRSRFYLKNTKDNVKRKLKSVPD